MTSHQTETPAEAAPARWSWERTNRWLTLGANLGVLLGLVVLIIEVRQNAALSRISLEAERAASQARYEMHMADPVMSEVWMKAVYTPEALTPAELRIMDANMVIAVMTWEHLMTMRDGGLVSDRRIAWHVELNAPFYFGFPFGKTWWRENAIGWQGSDLYPIADPIVQNVDEDFLARYYEKLRRTAPSQTAGTDDRAASKFSLLDLPREAVAPGIVRQYVTGEESTFSRWEVSAGGVVPMHSHYNEQVTLLLSGAAEVVSGEQRITLTEGDMLVLPPDVPHGYTFTEDSTVIEFFAPRRQDWIDAAGGRPSWANEP
jgi:quercetin dioxygenase-like cupin family protein